jgi:hypothetical protein
LQSLGKDKKPKKVLAAYLAEKDGDPAKRKQLLIKQALDN